MLRDDHWVRPGGAGLRRSRRLSSGAFGFGKARNAVLHEPLFLLGHRRSVDANLIRDRLLAAAFGADEDDLRPPDVPLRRLRFFDHGLKFLLLGGADR